MLHRFFAFAILFIASVAFADQRVEGHMNPLPSEFLSNPVTLDCGVVVQEVLVQEVRGSVRFDKLNSMCTHAYNNFWTFVDTKKLNTNNRERFSWNMSFLPEGTCYRCLNDETYRFKDRYVKGALIGYTDKDQRYSFMISNDKDREFNVTFVHELFHSMSMFYGVYDNHLGDWSQKTDSDEVLATEFTEWLGYGR